MDLNITAWMCSRFKTSKLRNWSRTKPLNNVNKSLQTLSGCTTIIEMNGTKHRPRRKWQDTETVIQQELWPHLSIPWGKRQKVTDSSTQRNYRKMYIHKLMTIKPEQIVDKTEKYRKRCPIRDVRPFNVCWFFLNNYLNVLRVVCNFQ